MGITELVIYIEGFLVFFPMTLNRETMCVGRFYETYVASGYVASGNWYNSSMDFVRLLDATEDDAYYYGYRFRGNQNYLARQAFLRSYKFCIEESFIDKLKRSVQRLSKESFEEIAKQAARNLKKAAKAIIGNHNQKLSARKVKQRMNLWPGACFRPSLSQDVDSRHFWSSS